MGATGCHRYNDSQRIDIMLLLCIRHYSRAMGDSGSGNDMVSYGVILFKDNFEFGLRLFPEEECIRGYTASFLGGFGISRRFDRRAR